MSRRRARGARGRTAATEPQATRRRGRRAHRSTAQFVPIDDAGDSGCLEPSDGLLCRLLAVLDVPPTGLVELAERLWRPVVVPVEPALAGDLDGGSTRPLGSRRRRGVPRTAAAPGAGWFWLTEHHGRCSHEHLTATRSDRAGRGCGYQRGPMPPPRRCTHD